MFKYKLVILVREDLKISCGKLAVQVAHAAVQCVLSCRNKKVLDNWIKEGGKKVVLKVNNLQELMKYYEMSINNDINACIIRDAGLTEVEPGTITVVGIGPDLEEKIDKITGNLKLLR